ncbi:transcription factor HES-5-like [Latimeria chalumnae]|uniref:transcription factor HES-5-like n=1 Tax=Latimeria chalumnae TaxID=7897 RepID=UPI00313CA19F
MASTNTAILNYNEDFTSKERNKLRKPIVEKMRRDRINNSIEQLKMLLRQEVQPNSKLEKADILEMAVSYLKEQNHLHLKTVASSQSNSHQDYKEGYTRCLQETLHFLSLHESKKEAQMKVLDHFQRVQTPAKELSSSVSPLHSPSCQTFPKQTAENNLKTLWRPW